MIFFLKKNHDVFQIMMMKNLYQAVLIRLFSRQYFRCQHQLKNPDYWLYNVNVRFLHTEPRSHIAESSVSPIWE